MVFVWSSEIRGQKPDLKFEESLNGLIESPIKKLAPKDRELTVNLVFYFGIDISC